MSEGFTPPETAYRLRFEDPALSGLIVTAAEVSVDEFTEVTDLAALGEPGQAGRIPRNWRRVLDIFAGSLVEWNVTDKRGEPVKADRAGVGSQKFPFMLKIITAWIEAQAGVPLPLPASSNGGAPFPEASIPMAPLSPNPPS